MGVVQFPASPQEAAQTKGLMRLGFGEVQGILGNPRLKAKLTRGQRDVYLDTSLPENQAAKELVLSWRQRKAEERAAEKTAAPEESLA
jgi:hypothetical protein